MRYALRPGVTAKLLLVSLACASCGSSGSAQGAGGETSDSGGGSSGKPGSGGGGRPHSNGGADSVGDAGDAGGGAGPMPNTPLGLWYGGISLCEFTPTQLEASADHNPQILVPIESLTAVSDVAFDASGSAWVVGTGSDSIFRFSAASLEQPASAKPDLVISSTALEAPGNLAFDANGSLWVATRPASDSGTVKEGSILRFDVPDGKSGKLSLSPAAQISSMTEGDLDLIGNITFDAAQNLWVSSLVGLLRFDNPVDEKGAVTLEPSAVIDKIGYTNNIHFYSVAFDSSGALWAASADGLHYLTSVTEFADPGSLEGRSSPEATATIKGVEDVLPAGGLAFDGSGNLWLARANGLVMYSDPGSLRGTVEPDADITLTVKGDAVPSTSSHLLFVPSPTDG
ncbi:MAG: hypothetical protein WDO69_35105 [Pseudomonadota bacterium]